MYIHWLLLFIETSYLKSMESEENYNTGSEWIKCDLHVHTPYSIEQSYGDGQSDQVWEEFIDDLEALPKEFKIIGINDYIFIDGYRKILEFKKIGRLQNIDLILPVIELRIDKFGSINSDNPFKRVNFHIIFSNELSPDIIQNQFLNSLSSEYKIFADYQSTESDWGGLITRDSLIDLGNKLKESSQGALTGSSLKIGFQSLNIPYSQLMEKLKNIHIKGKYLTAVGKTEWDAMRWTGSPAEKKSVINTADFVFISSADTEAFNKSKASLKSQNVNDLLLDCSDAHTYSTKTNNKDRIGNCFTWVKINPTFKGLMYLLYEPKGRIYIGAEPEIHIRVRNNKTRYIKKITIDQIEGYNESKGVWFKEQIVYPSKELTAIIGNKGKGKSAITDIIGLLGNSHNFEYFSFLSSKKFRKSGLAKNFKAKLVWESGFINEANLHNTIDYDLEEKVKYLPQSYFEDLCNEIENNENFKKEINQVVFTHLDETERLDKATFEEFIDLKKQNAEDSIDDLRQRLFDINDDLINLQRKGTDEHKKNIESKIETIQAEIDSHLKNKPIDPYPNEENGDSEDENKGENFKKLQQTTQELTKLIQEKENLIDKLTILNSELTTLNQILHRFESEQERIKAVREEEGQELEPFNISIEDVYPTPIINLVPIDKVISNKKKEKLIVELQLGRKEYSTGEHQKLISNKDELLNYKISTRKAEIETLSKTLDAKEKAIESFKNQLLQWKKTLADKKGNEKLPSPGTLYYFKNQLKFITEELDSKIEQKKSAREEITKDIYDKKKSIVDIYSHFKSNIDKKLSENMIEIKEYEISLEASMQIRNFVANFLEYIDKGRAGSFRGQEEAEAAVKEFVEVTDPNSEESIIKFLQSITNKLEYANDSKQNLFSQIKESKELKDLYNYMYGLKYLDEKYELKFLGKSIEQLSPGERGAALIVFYLLLDNDDKPLIIDQPEDNLDNQSVFEVLVPFIRQAKKKRQLIIVTHNPNLAVVADAEQIIHVDLDKKNNRVTHLVRNYF